MADPATLFIQGIVVVLGLVGLFYLYQYLFSGGAASATSLIGPKQAANPTQPIVISSTNIPALYEGGEFSVSMWLYINNWSTRNGFNKHILSIGGQTLDTLRIYLGPFTPSLQVRINSPNGSGPVTAKAAAGVAPAPGLLGSSASSLSTTANAAGSGNTKAAVFETLQTGASLIDGPQLCDLPSLDLQRWVNIVVCVNNKTVDVYLDGKLARSCVLPQHYRVDAGGYAATLLDVGGFGGYISTVNMFNQALGPDTIYHAYMAGPQPITNFLDYLKSFFTPSPQGP
jgi:hypothetical protein